MDFKWLNEGQVKTNGDKIEIFAPAQSDFFFNNGAIGEEGITPESLCNAPFYYTEIRPLPFLICFVVLCNPLEYTFRGEKRARRTLPKSVRLSGLFIYYLCSIRA